VVLAWVLYFKKDPFRPGKGPDQIQSTLRVMIGWLRSHFGLFRQSSRLLLYFLCYKFQVWSRPTGVQLSAYGQIAVPVHQGYKVFDFPKGVVRKVFDQNVEALVVGNEIEQMRNIFKIDFAPSIQQWNIEEKWYEEDCLSGSIDTSYAPMDSRTLLKKFSDEVAQPLSELILFQQPQTICGTEYIQEMMKNVEASRLAKQESTKTEFREIQRFLNSMVEQLLVEGHDPVLLVLTHGDFCPENMLNANQGLKIIDWESATWRTALFDFYSYFFYRSALKNISPQILDSEIKEGLRITLSRLTTMAPDMVQRLMEWEDVYRRFFYIERIYMLVIREMTDQNLNILRDHIMKYIVAFQNYEETLLGKTRMIA